VGLRLGRLIAEEAWRWDGGLLRTFERAGRTALVLRTV
jgi:hypothetical protein